MKEDGQGETHQEKVFEEMRVGVRDGNRKTRKESIGNRGRKQGNLKGTVQVRLFQPVTVLPSVTVSTERDGVCVGRCLPSPRFGWTSNP